MLYSDSKDLENNAQFRFMYFMLSLNLVSCILAFYQNIMFKRPDEKEVKLTDWERVQPVLSRYGCKEEWSDRDLDLFGGEECQIGSTMICGLFILCHCMLGHNF